jgi:hypothetical protein
MSKRIAYLGIFALAMIAANPPGAAKAWDPCYDRPPCPPKYYTGCYHCYPRDYYARYPHYVYHRYYEEYPRRYVRYGGYDAYDGSRYRYYSSYQYDDDYGW